MFCWCTLYQHQHQYSSWPYYRAPSLGPNRHQHGRRFLSRTEPQISYNKKRESSGTIEGDRSTGIRPCYAWIGAHFNTVVGEVWRIPSKNPFTVESNLTLTDANKILPQVSSQTESEDTQWRVRPVNVRNPNQKVRWIHYPSRIANLIITGNSLQEVQWQAIRRFRRLRHHPHRLSRYQQTLH